LTLHAAILCPISLLAFPAMLAVLRCLVAFTWAHVAHAAPCEPSKEDGERLQRVLGQADLRITEQKAQGIYTQLDPVARTVLDLLCFGM